MSFSKPWRAGSSLNKRPISSCSTDLWSTKLANTLHYHYFTLTVRPHCLPAVLTRHDVDATVECCSLYLISLFPETTPIGCSMYSLFPRGSLVALLRLGATYSLLHVLYLVLILPHASTRPAPAESHISKYSDSHLQVS